MKKSLFILIFLFVSLRAFSSDLEFSLAPATGLSSCKIDEILYDSSLEPVSLLEWKQDYILETGLSARLKNKKCLYDLSFFYSFPLAQGQMTDTDWEYGEQYSFTKHVLLKTKSITGQLSFSYSAIQKSFFCLMPQAQLQYLYFSFNAQGGTGTRNGSPIKTYGIDYYRHSLFTFAGARFNFMPASSVDLYADFLFSPFCYEYAYDYHHGVKNPFASIDTQKGCFSKFKAVAGLQVKINPRLSFESDFSLIFGPADKGDFYLEEGGLPMSKVNQKSGAAINHKSLKCFLRINL